MNQDFDAFGKEVQRFSEWLDSIPPYEYSMYATILGYIIAYFLTTNAQNALGNWIEQVGQIILTISAQASATPTDDDYTALKSEVQNLRKELNELKAKQNQ